LIGQWQVGGRTVLVTASTRLEGRPADYAVGVMVKVYATQGADGVITAREIELEQDED
jgi:hypothetical protein